jgi:hypothetical protein
LAHVDTRRQSLEREQLERDRVRRLLDEMDQAKTCVRTDPEASEAYGYQTYTFDARNSIPRIGRVLIAQGPRQAADPFLSLFLLRIQWRDHTAR